MWNYVFYKVYLLDKDIVEYNGNETYIHNKMMKKDKDFSWFPLGKTLSI